MTIFKKVRLRPTQLRTVADRRFDDADALRKSGQNARANGEAIGACTQCGRGICSECAVTIQGRMLCRDCVQIVPVDMSRQHAEERNLKLKDPASAAAMSMLHGGLGQIYNGEIAKGLGLMSAKVFVLIVAIVMFASGVWYAAVPLLIFGWGGLWSFGVWDAYKSATRHNQKQFEFGPNANEWSKGHY